jgi:hypothetical protein
VLAGAERPAGVNRHPVLDHEPGGECVGIGVAAHEEVQTAARHDAAQAVDRVELVRRRAPDAGGVSHELVDPVARTGERGMPGCLHRAVHAQAGPLERARDRLHERRRQKHVPEPPPRHREVLRERPDQDRALERARQRRDRAVPEAVVDEVRVRLVADHPEVVPLGQLQRSLEILVPEHVPGRIDRRVEKEDAGAVGDGVRHRVPVRAKPLLLRRGEAPQPPALALDEAADEEPRERDQDGGAGLDQRAEAEVERLHRAIRDEHGLRSRVDALRAQRVRDRRPQLRLAVRGGVAAAARRRKHRLDDVSRERDDRRPTEAHGLDARGGRQPALDPA